MRLTRLIVQGFRRYKEATEFPLSDITALIGQNDAGKSTVLEALAIFFDEKRAPEHEDICVHAEKEEVRLTCDFEDLPDDLVLDAEHPTSLADELLLTQEGTLRITKVYNCPSGKPKCSDIIAWALHPNAEPYNDLLSLNITSLKKRAQELEVPLEGVNQSVCSELRRAIWQHATDMELKEQDVSLQGTQTKSIWAKLYKALPKFFLFRADRPSTDQDAEVQDPMKGAVEQAIRNQETELAAVTQEVERRVQEIADRTVQKIGEMSPTLASQLTPRVSTKKWESLFQVSLTGDDQIPINKRGSGTRRLVLLSFFRAQAEAESTDTSSGIIYSIEEPETSQHPSNQLMLLEALSDLANLEGCQVIVTTHTPMLARRLDTSSLLYISTAEDGLPSVEPGGSEHIMRQLTRALGVLPDHGIKVFFGVEGRNDIRFFRNISKMLSDAGEKDIPDLAAEEASGRLVFVPLGGSSLDLWVNRLQQLNRPEFYIFDRDSRPPEPPHYKEQADAFNADEQCTAWHTGKLMVENYLHPDVLKTRYSLYEGPPSAGDEHDFADIPELVSSAYALYTGKTITKKTAKEWLNRDVVGMMNPELLTSIDPDDELRGWLRQIGDALKV